MSERQDNTVITKHGKRDKEKKCSKLGRHNGDVGVNEDDSGAVEFNADGGNYSARKTKRREKNKKNNEGSSESARLEDEYIKEVEGKLRTEKATESGYRMKSDNGHIRDSKHKKRMRNTKDGDGKREQDGKHCGFSEELVDGQKTNRKRRRDRIGWEEKCSGKTLGTKTEGDPMADRKAKKKNKKKEVEQKKMTDEEADHKLLPAEENMSQNVDGDVQSPKRDGRGSKEVKKNKKLKKEGKNEVDSSASQLDISVRDNYSSGITHFDEVLTNEVEHRRKKKKRKAKTVDNGCVTNSEKKKKKKKKKSVEDYANVPTANKSSKKVSFSSRVEIFPLPMNTEEGSDEEVNVVQGKRFTEEEDEILKQAVTKYIADHNLGENGLDMVLNCKKHPEVRGCWHEIASSIPYRPRSAVYYRTQTLYRRSDDRKWTKEDYETVLKHVEEHGKKWKELSVELQKHRVHVKDTWRRIKLQNRKKGHWDQSEYQNLFNLVNVDLQNRVSEEKKSKHGMLRDNISWSDISDKLSTRAPFTCCIKWYDQLTSPMVAQGLWSDTDDYRLITALYNLDATCMEDVDWDDLLDHRPGNICRRRWNQMVRHIGHYVTKSFAEQVEILAQRYCPHLLETRETWDSKPRVP